MASLRRWLKRCTGESSKDAQRTASGMHPHQSARRIVGRLLRSFHLNLLILDLRAVQAVEFESHDPTTMGEMIITCAMNDVLAGATDLYATPEGVPA